LHRYLVFILFISMTFGGKIKIDRKKINNLDNPPRPQTNYTLKLITETGVETMPVQKYHRLSLFRNFHRPPLTRMSRYDTMDLLVLRVEFVEDDDTLTTGNGKMDLVGNGEPGDLFYDPPHTKIYFERHMQFLNNYYKVNSFGKQVINTTVKPDDPTRSFQLPNKMRYYCGFDHYDPETGLVWFNVYAMEMGLVRILVDAIAAADQDATIDFSDYDGVAIIHAGAGREVSLSFGRFCDIHSVHVPSAALEYYIGTPYVLANAGTDTIRECVIDPEMERIDDYMVGVIGTICHEMGHLLGLPDLYDVSGWSNGVGAWDVMCTGGFAGSPSEGAPDGSIPAMLSAWSRYFMGWVAPKIVTDAETLLTLRASEIDTTQYALDTLTMIKIPISETEYFLIENRQQDINQDSLVIVDVEDDVPISIDYGEYDFFLPGSGILIWHIDDEVVSLWADSLLDIIQIDPKHKGVDLEEADGIQHFDAWWYVDSLEYNGSRYDPFFVDDSSKANHHFGPFTKPNSDSYYGKSMINIEVKSQLDTLMDFSLSFDAYQSGFPVVVRNFYSPKSVSYGDLDGDGTKEVVVAIERGSIHAYYADGSVYGINPSPDIITTFLAIGDINNDQADDIIFCTDKQLVLLDGHTLTPLPGVPFSADDEILGAPLLFDINGDSHLEIIFGSKDGWLYCVNDSAVSIQNFPIYLNDWILSTPCVFDESKRQIGVLTSNGTFWIVSKDGIVKEFTDSKHNMLTYASPVVGDLDRDGSPEAVIINGFGTIYIYGEDTLEQWFDILIDTTFYATPGLADIDNDGYLEIIMPNSSKTLYVTNRNGTSEDNFPVYYNEYISYPMLVCDLDDDNKEELVFGLETEDSIGGAGQLKIINDRKEEFQFSPLFGEGGFASPGVIFDLDGDGDLELACASNYCKLYIWDFPGTDVSWSGYMNSPKNWGNYSGQLTQPQVASGLLGSCYIYPSPVETNGTVRFFLKQAADVVVDIMDIVGHKIGTVEVSNPTANEYNEVNFNFEKQSNGIYIVRVEAKNGGKREVKFKKFAVLK